jgi:hypothetical protein
MIGTCGMNRVRSHVAVESGPSRAYVDRLNVLVT